MIASQRFIFEKNDVGNLVCKNTSISGNDLGVSAINLPINCSFSTDNGRCWPNVSNGWKFAKFNIYSSLCNPPLLEVVLHSRGRSVVNEKKTTKKEKKIGTIHGQGVKSCEQPPFVFIAAQTCVNLVDSENSEK